MKPPILLIATTILLLSIPACTQKHSPQAREAANQCYSGNGHKWEECGASADHPPWAMFIHKPTKGCPEGYLLIHKFFSEGDGTHRDACVKKAPYPGAELPRDNDGFVEISIDVLYGGEGFSQTMHIELPTDDGSKKRI